MVNGQRAFGGQLTTSTSVPSSIAGSLAGDAPEFIPGRPVVTRGKSVLESKISYYGLSQSSPLSSHCLTLRETMVQLQLSHY